MRYLILLLFTIDTSCNSLKNDCSEFRNGIFKYKDAELKEYVIIRNDSIQIETNNNNKIQIITSVNWVSECEYNLTYKKIQNYTKEKDFVGDVINVKIIEIKGDSYIARVRSLNTDSTIELIKIR